jgi:hypothetical protein
MIYLITYPDNSQITSQGISITTVTRSRQVEIPLSYPHAFYLMFSAYPSGSVVATSTLWSYTYPYICNIYTYSGGVRQEVNFCGTNALGQTISGNRTTTSIGYANTYYITPPRQYQTITNCDVLVTDSSGNVLTIPGKDNIACPTWTSTPENDCLPTEIKCPSTTDPRGFCCIDCSTLDTTLRGLIV